jgi:hypothetical protein
LAYQLNQTRRSLGQRISSTLKRHSQANIINFQSIGGLMCPNEELLIIKRKLHNLRREKKAFRTLGLILSALLICWLPFFVTLPVMSILKHHGMINDENTENTWFKIAFWLGYCNSAVGQSHLDIDRRSSLIFFNYSSIHLSMHSQIVPYVAHSGRSCSVASAAAI